MKEVFERLYCGNDNDWLNLEKEHVPGRDIDQPTKGWAVLHAAKEHSHREFLNYSSRGAPKGHPEYLFAERGNRLALNIVDAPKPEFFAKEMIDKGLEFIEQKLDEGLKVLCHCNQGESRSPSLCLIYLIKHGIITGDTLEDCEAEFMKVYPDYNPGAGVRGFIKEHWEDYIANKTLEYCPLCKYDLLVKEKVVVDGIEMYKVDCNECGADLGYEDL